MSAEPEASRRLGRGALIAIALAAMLAVQTVQEAYATITGRRYPLPSLPSRAELDAIRREKEPLLREGQSLRWVDEISAKVLAAL